MRWMPSLAVAAVLLFFALSLAHTNAQDSGVVYGLINDTDVQLRVGPDFAYPIMTELPIHGSVEVLGRTGFLRGSFTGSTWLNVRHGDQTGWVLGRTVRMGRAFNSIPLTAYQLPRNQNGRVPPEFDLSRQICDFWQGQYTQSGDFMAGGQEIVVTYPQMPGAVNYSVVVISPTGRQRTFDSPELTQVIRIGAISTEPGTFTWGVIPYWNWGTDPQEAQQLCVLRVGGTFEKPDTSE